MNEQLKQLAEQAEEYTRLKHNNAYWRLLDNMQEDLTWREKFAELIVRDCISQIALIGISNFESDDISWTADIAIKNIKERFNIK